MGRNRKNKSEEFFISNNFEIKHNLSQVKIPFWVNVTYKVKVSEDNNGKPIYGTTDQIVRCLHYTTDEITKKFQEKGFEVINFEQVTVPFPDLCPQCRKIGIPKIEKYSNKYDYHPRRGSPMFRKSGTEKTEVNRPDQYYLTYDHKINGKLKKCKITKFDINHMLFINAPNKINEIHKHFFPYCVEWMKKLTAEA